VPTASDPVGPRHPSVARLRRLSRRRSERAREAAVVIDGPVLLAEALDAGIEVQEVLVDLRAPEGVRAVAGRAAQGGAVVRDVVPEALERAGATVTPNSVVAVAARPEVPLEGAVQAATAAASALVLVGVADPGNAGTLLRVAEASGIGAVLFCGDSVDPCNPKCVRASAGALFHVAVTSGGEAVEVLEALGEAGLRRAATTLEGALPYDHADLRGPVALVLGNEAHGLPDGLDDVLDETLTIPMVGRAESLNVAMAGAVLCFEALRQRRAGAAP
jgi:RNA methyltransferase, TrmH family